MVSADIAGDTQIETLTLITTSRLRDRTANLVRLRNSVKSLPAVSLGIRVRHYLLIQGTHELPGGLHAQLAGPDLRLHCTSQMLGLSEARNTLIEKIGQAEFENALVAFPDDDAWYPDKTLPHLVELFRAHGQLDLCVCRTGPTTQDPDVVPQGRLGLQSMISNGTSNAIFLRGSLVVALGRFDETLGLGTPARSGEDTDYVLRAFRIARERAFLDGIIVGHRAFDQRDRVRYFAGALYAIARHARAVRWGYLALIRKCFIGVLWVVLGQMSYKDLLHHLTFVLNILKNPQL